MDGHISHLNFAEDVLFLMFPAIEHDVLPDEGLHSAFTQRPESTSNTP
jgi:hypothetical protein